MTTRTNVIACLTIGLLLISLITCVTLYINTPPDKCLLCRSNSLDFFRYERHIRALTRIHQVVLEVDDDDLKTAELLGILARHVTSLSQFPYQIEDKLDKLKTHLYARYCHNTTASQNL